MSVLFTHPGKIGDTFLQLPVVRAWSRMRKMKVTLGISEGVEPILPLLEKQPYVERVVVLRERIKNYNVGGQPDDFSFTKADYRAWDQVFHCGMLGMPSMQITRYTARALRIPMDDEDYRYPAIEVEMDPTELHPARVLVHGKRFSNTGSDPRFWGIVGRFTRSGELAKHFPEIVAIGTPEEIRDARNRLAITSYLADDGDWLKIAHNIAHSGLVIDASSGIAALAGAIGVPCIRIHDPIGDLPHEIWSNQPTPHQLNLGLLMGDKEVTRYLEELHGEIAGRVGGQADDREPEGVAPPGLDTPSVDTLGAVASRDDGGGVPAEAGPDR